MSNVRAGEDATTTGRTKHRRSAGAQRTGTPRSGRGENGTRGTVVVGGGQFGCLVGRQLTETGAGAVQGIHFVDTDSAAISRAAREHEATLVDDLTSRHALEPVVDGATTVVVATPSDATTLLVVGHLRASFEIPRIVAVVRDPRTRDAYPPDIECVCATTLLAEAVVESVR